MKKLFLFISLAGMLLSVYPQSQWYPISKNEPADFFPNLISSSSDYSETILEFNLGGFFITDVNAPVQNSKIISIPRTGRISKQGEPDLPQLTAPLIIPDMANMEIEIIETEFFVLNNIEIAPSKGDFSRQIDPNTIPYIYGDVYQQNDWYPGKMTELSPPHILRDFRATVAIVYPFQYNPVTKELKVYSKIIVKVSFSETPEPPVNPLYRDKPITSIVEDFHYVYKERYLNYSPNKYTAPLERGPILVISHGAFVNDMLPYVKWKNQIGFPTEIVSVSTIGNTSANIKNYVNNYYNTNGLAFLLIVGDHTQVVTYSYGASPYGTQFSDNWYGDLAGNDAYVEVLVGRFSATTSTHVQTQVQRTIEYEKATGMTTGWQTYGMGVARNEGAGAGHDGGESDCQHMNNIRTRLLNYNYTVVHQDYDYNCGVPNTTATQISNRLNAGVTVLNYCNHGSETGWSVASYNITHVNALTNVKKLPFIWSVACLNGQFTYSSDCFAEAWLKARHNVTGEPTGAIGVYMSTISQPWVPPMDAQDEFNRIMCELIAGKIRRTYGAISKCGTFHMLDLAPTNNDRLYTARTWTIFGDPSLMVRTHNPTSMTVTHGPTILDGATNLVVNCNTNNAFVTLTINYNIIGTGIISGGTSNITFAPVNAGDTILVTVTAYNKIPYEGIVVVEAPSISLDAQAYNIIYPLENYACPGDIVTPTVVIRNFGILNLTSCNIYYQLNANPEQSISWTGNLATLQTSTVLLPQFILETGVNQYKFRIGEPNGGTDGNPSNNEFVKEFIVEYLAVIADFSANYTQFCQNPAVVQFINNSQNTSSYLWDFGDGSYSTEENPIHEYQALGLYTVSLIASAGFCGSDTAVFPNMILVGAEIPYANDQESCAPASFTLNAIGSGSISWFDDISGLNLIHSGSSFVTPTLNNTTTYYFNSSIQGFIYGGRPDNSGTGGYFNSNYSHGLVLNCITPTLLKSVKVYAATAGNRTIRLEDSDGNLIASRTVNIPVGESRITLDIDIPVGTGLKLMGPTFPNLFRNGSSTMNINYPFEIGNYISIIKSTAPGYELNYYYYFYDWEIVESCVSAMADVTAYVLDIPTASFSADINGNTVYFTNNSTGGNLTYLWNFGDGNTSTEENPVHTYQTAGTYNVTLTVSNSCGNDIDEQIVTITHLGSYESVADFEIYPNPAEGHCIISCAEIIKELNITDIQGKLIKTLNPHASIIKVDLSNFAQGLYYIKIITKFGSAVKLLKVK